MPQVSEQSGLLVVGLFFSILIYVLFSTLDLVLLAGGSERLPPTIQLVHNSLAMTFSKPGRSTLRSIAEFVLVAVSTQVMPVLLLLWPTTATELKVASAVELALALGWTVYLVTATGRRR